MPVRGARALQKQLARITAGRRVVEPCCDAAMALPLSPPGRVAANRAADLKYRRGLRLMILLLGLGGTAFLTLTWMASSRLICPPRAVVQDQQREILQHPADHGLVVVA